MCRRDLQAIVNALSSGLCEVVVAISPDFAVMNKSTGLTCDHTGRKTGSFRWRSLR